MGASQTDWDKGGTTRQLVKFYLGPSVGWQYAPQPGILFVTSASATAVLGTNLILVNFNGAVALTLPKAAASAAGAQALPGTFLGKPITIVDIGGFTSTINPITITPGDGTIDGFATIKIQTSYGAMTLQPLTPSAGYTVQTL